MKMADFMMNYGEALKYQREKLGISQLELSKRIGISHQNINRWESGDVLPSIDFCVKLADFYGITVDELIGKKHNFVIIKAPALKDARSFLVCKK